MRKTIGAATALAASFLLAACGGQPEAQPPPAPQVSVAAPLQETVVDWSDFVGRFEAPNRVEVRARTGGFIEQVHFRDGQTVRRGQLLFTLDPRIAQAQVAAAEAQAEQAKGELARAETLLKAQAVSQEEYEGRRAAARIAEATLRLRRQELEFTRVVAPASGVVSDRRVDPGNVIAGGSSAGDVLTTIVSVSPIHFVFEVSEAQVLQMQRDAGEGGAPVEVRLQDEGDYRWRGALDFTDNAVDPSSGAVRMRATIANPNGFLKPGMFGHGRLRGAKPYAALLVPDTAVQSDGPRKVVLVVGPDGTVAAKPVQLGPLSDGLRVVRTGLRPDDRVVVGGALRVRPGQKAEAKPTAITRAGTPAQEAPAPQAPPASRATPAAAR